MALVGIELETLVSESDALTTRSVGTIMMLFFYYRSICIIDDGASRRRTRISRFRARRADHSTTSMCNTISFPVLFFELSGPDRSSAFKFGHAFFNVCGFKTSFLMEFRK